MRYKGKLGFTSLHPIYSGYLIRIPKDVLHKLTAWGSRAKMYPHFYDQPEITISHRKPGDPPIGYVDLMDLKGLKPDPFVLRLQARQYAKLAFRDVTPHSFRVDYADVQYLNSPYAKPAINWIETSEVHGAYVFEHRNGCWYLTQDLRVPRR
jgi:hypothetical protein